MLTLTEAGNQIRTRRLSPVELTRECLTRTGRLNPVLNAFITVTGELALEQARLAEGEVMAGNYCGPLHGIPIGLKDLFDTAGIRTTAASNQFRDRVPAEDAELVRQLKQAGAVILGKLNLHEFAFGVSGIVSAFGPVRNPWNTERITGGSSSGSAAAVAAEMCVAAIGTDTAGSVRCPAALCGIVGHRPSAGLLSAKGIIPLSLSNPALGRCPTMPHNAAGQRTDPAVSVPIAATHISAATAAAEPEEDPPVILSGSQGFFTAPNALTIPLTPNANS